MAAMSRSSSGEATDVGIGPMQSQGSVLSWSQPSYSKLSVRNVQQIDKYVSDCWCYITCLLQRFSMTLDSVIARTLGSLLVLTRFAASPDSH